MITDKELFLPAIDTLLIFLILLFIGIFAISYDSNKGLGEEKCLPVIPQQVDDANFFNNPYTNFSAIFMYNDYIELAKVENRKIQEKEIYSSLNRLKEKLDNQSSRDEIFVLYEIEKTSMLSEMIIMLLNFNIKILIARQ